MVAVFKVLLSSNKKKKESKICILLSNRLYALELKCKFYNYYGLIDKNIEFKQTTLLLR